MAGDGNLRRRLRRRRLPWVLQPRSVPAIKDLSVFICVAYGNSPRQSEGAARAADHDDLVLGLHRSLDTIHQDVGDVVVGERASAVSNCAKLRRVDGLEVDPHGIGFAVEHRNI